MSIIRSVDWRNLLTRAGWTALQAFLAVVLIGLDPILDLIFKGDWTGSWTAFVALATAGVAAALSAIKTLILELIERLKES